ncbi:hypothetical protein F5887DRAFT_975123 [Amanita rubescens]|nr:hypothetical protein F5887DRAFT_975123 [Amanita rubescens]
MATAINIEMARMRHQEPSHFLSEDQTPPSPGDNRIDPIPTSASFKEDLASIRPAWKRNLNALLEHPTSSPSAFIIHMFTTFLILLSALVTVLETVPAFHSIPTRIWFGLETSLVALFTVEYIARCLAWSSTWLSLLKWMTSFYGIIDVLAVIPYYIELIMQQDTSVLFRFSILRMFRLLRVFRPFRYNHTILLTIEVMYLSVRRSQHALLALGFFVIMILTVFSTLLYFAERGTWDETLGTFINSDGDPSQFSSIPAAGWFVLVTISTVGYGEITPRSFLGRLITIPILVFGLLTITLPSFVLGREFSIVWEKMSKNRPREEQQGDSYVESEPAFAPPGIQRDLSNLKLAQNQTELSQQIARLHQVVEAQARLIQRLVDGTGEQSPKKMTRIDSQSSIDSKSGYHRSSPGG